HSLFAFIFLFNCPSPTQISTLSLHDALPIYDTLNRLREKHRQTLNLVLPSLSRFGSVAVADLCVRYETAHGGASRNAAKARQGRSEEHTSELQSRGHLVCRLLLEKKKKKKIT